MSASPRANAADPEVHLPGVAVTVTAFHFERKQERAIKASEAAAAMDDGCYVWFDIDVTDAELARQSLGGLAVIREEILEDALRSEPATQIARYDECLHLAVTGCRLAGANFDLERVDIIVGGRSLATVHRGPTVFLESMKRQVSADFQRFAKSPSFLVFELWDHLIDNYLSVQKRFEERVGRLQAELIGSVDDKVFARVSEIGSDLLHFRKILLPARSVLADLSTRKSMYISETTQPFLANMVGTVERVLQDLIVDKDILSESLNLYMSMVSHRTNRVMNKLTVVSVIFLPLTFLCGVYGMNFEIIPELRWTHGYALFWGIAGVLTAGIIWVMRRMKLL